MLGGIGGALSEVGLFIGIAGQLPPPELPLEELFPAPLFVFGSNREESRFCGFEASANKSEPIFEKAESIEPVMAGDLLSDH